MHPYQELCHLLREYQLASDAMDCDAALAHAMMIRAAASELVVLAAKNAEDAGEEQRVNGRQLRLPQ